MVVVCNALVIMAAKLLFGQRSAATWYVDLYVNLHAPNPGDPLSLYSICSLPGYAQVALNGADWKGGLSGPGVVFYQQPQITWNLGPYSGPQQTIYGYVVSDGGEVLYAELFPAPFPVPNTGGELPLLLTWQDEQCVPS
jgi:hypothetical protein